MSINKYGLPIKRKADGSLYRLTPAQLRQVTRLIKTHCCNCVDMECLLLDEGDGCGCPQMISYSLICRWFCNAVLPLAPELESEIFRDKHLKICIICGSKFVPKSNRQKYCEICRIYQERKADAERKRKERSGMS